MIFGKLITEPNINESYDCAEEAYNIIRETYIQESSIFEAVLGSDFAEVAFNKGTITEEQMMAIQESSTKEAGSKLLAMIKTIGKKIASLFINLTNRIKALFKTEGEAIILKYSHDIETKIEEGYYKNFKFEKHESISEVNDFTLKTRIDTSVGTIVLLTYSDGDMTAPLTDSDKDEIKDVLADIFMHGSKYDTFEEDYIKKNIGKTEEKNGISVIEFHLLQHALTADGTIVKNIENLRKEYDAYYTKAEKDANRILDKVIRRENGDDASEYLMKQSTHDEVSIAISNNAAIYNIVSTFTAKVITLYNKVAQIEYDNAKEIIMQLHAYKQDKAETEKK